MSKEIMDRIKVLTAMLDPAEIAVLTGWLHRQVRMDVPHNVSCPHYSGADKECRYPEVVE